MRHLLIDDGLEHALAHRADGSRDLHVGFPLYRGPALGLAQGERSLHVHDRADAVALARQLREVRLTLLELLHAHLHLQATEAERDLHVRGPVAIVLDVEALDARHRLRHRGRIVEYAPDRVTGRVELLLAFDLHAVSSPFMHRRSAAQTDARETHAS